MKRHIFLSILFAFTFVVETKALDNTISSEINKTSKTTEGKLNIDCKDCSLSLSYGVIQFHGDISENNDWNSGLSIQFNIPIAKQNFMQNFTLQTEFITGNISAQNSKPVGINGSQGRAGNYDGEKFNMEFMEFDINLVINLSKLVDELIKKKTIGETELNPQVNNQKFDFLCKAGVGLNMFRSLRQELNTEPEQFINSYGYEWLWQNDFENAGTQKSGYESEGVFVLGIITNYKVSEQWDVNFSATSRFGNTDKWDAKLSDNNDIFMFYSLGTTFKLSKN